MPLKCGDTVQMLLGHPTIPHLWILVTEPDPQTKLAVIVSVTTLRGHSDTTLVLHKGDHPFIIRPSIVSYTDAREYRVDKIEQRIADGWPKCDPCSTDLLRQIQDGLLASPYTALRIKAVCRERWNMKTSA